MTEKNDKEIYVGAVIELNQKQVNLIPSTPINKIDQLGLKLSLDKPLELGTLGDAMNSICSDIGVSNPLDPEKLKKIESPLLKTVADKVASANMRIEALKYEQPPAKEEKPTKYVFVASVNWKEVSKSQDTKDTSRSQDTKDFFKIKGLIVGISSGFTSSETGENEEIRMAFQSALQAMVPEKKALAAATSTTLEANKD